ncbi:MAG TPA: ABC transporter permease [Candidatus Limnocylindrales bacterium]|nr:ABC transporter permease [Candidatus Limnocylindrales bacterium]
MTVRGGGGVGVRRGAAAPVLVVAAILVAWEVACRATGVSPIVLPSPARILEQLWLFRGEALRHLVPTLVETLVGLGVSVAFAVTAAATMDRFASVRAALQPLLVASQTIPVVAIAPLLVLWFGFGLAPKILIVVLVTFFPIAVALLGGFAASTVEASDLMRSFGASRRQAFAKLRWPAALPSLFTGLRIAATYGVIGAVFGEYVGAYEGLGIWMQLSQNAFRTDLVFGAILLSAAVSVTLFGSVVAAERAAIPWYVASHRAR